MKNPPSGKSYFPVFFSLCLILLFVIIISKSELVTILLSIAIVASITVVGLSQIKSANLANLVARLYEKEKKHDRSIANGIIGELLAADRGGKSPGPVAAELIGSRFRLEKFAIFFREGDRLIPRVYGGIRPASLRRPIISQLQLPRSNSPVIEMIPDQERILDSLFRKREWQDFRSPLVFDYRWGRSEGMVMAADDVQGLLTTALRDSEFSRVFWPVLGSYIYQDVRLSDAFSEKRRLQNELTAARKDLSKLNKDLNQKLLDIHSFVEISGRLYTIFNEDQLFAALKEIVCSRLGAEKAEILCYDGDGKFTCFSGDQSDWSNLILESDSRFYELLAKSPKPLLLPIVGSGFEGDELFLNAAIAHGFQISSAIRVGNKMACVLLIAERSDKAHYTDSDLDFLSTITNIVSLSLENIRQYSTIEKLSYTDSMTGVYNYRYFYKRLIEEILRAKRYNRDLALVLLDIDNFKIFNDKYGHQTGDIVLKRMAGIITDTIRSIDVVSRYGGEEFCIIMPDTSAVSCRKFIERLRSDIAAFRLESEIFTDNSVITVSVGGAVFPQDATNVDRLIYCADMALLKAKASGRNRAVMYLPEFADKEESSIGGMQ